MAKVETKKSQRVGVGTGAQARRPSTAPAPPAGLIAGSNNPDVLIGWMQQSLTYLGTGGTKILKNPDPVVQQQANALGTYIYDELLDKDSHAASVVDTRINAVTGLPREIVAGNDGANAQRIRDVIATVFDRWYSYEQDSATHMLALVHGYRPAEAEYVLWEDGLWGIRKLHDRSPDSFMFDVDGKLRLRTQGKMFEGDLLPERKFVVLVHQPRALNPYGVGLGRTLWWMSWIKRNGLKSWLVAVEKFGVPTIWMQHEPGLGKAKRQALVDAGNKVMTDAVIATSKDVDLTLLETRGGISGHLDLCVYIDDQMSKRVLGQTATTDAKNTGLNSSQPTIAGKVRQDILERDALWLGSSYSETLIRWLVEFNFGSGVPEEDYPYLMINAAPPEDLASVAAVDSILVKDLSLPLATSYFYERYLRPKPEGTDELIGDAIAEAAKASMPAGLDPMQGLDANGDPIPPSKKKPPKPKPGESAKKFAERVDLFYNKRHEPAGSSKGGEFAPKDPSADPGLSKIVSPEDAEAKKLAIQKQILDEWDKPRKTRRHERVVEEEGSPSLREEVARALGVGRHDVFIGKDQHGITYVGLARMVAGRRVLDRGFSHAKSGDPVEALRKLKVIHGEP